MRIVYLQVWRVKYSLAKIRKASRELLTLDDKVRNFKRLSFDRFWAAAVRSAGSRHARGRFFILPPGGALR